MGELETWKDRLIKTKHMQPIEIRFFILFLNKMGELETWKDRLIKTRNYAAH